MRSTREIKGESGGGLRSEGGPALWGPRAAIRLFLLSFVFDCFYDLGGALRLVLEGDPRLGGPAHGI